MIGRWIETKKERWAHEIAHARSKLANRAQQNLLSPPLHLTSSSPPCSPFCDVHGCETGGLSATVDTLLIRWWSESPAGGVQSAIASPLDKRARTTMLTEYVLLGDSNDMGNSWFTVPNGTEKSHVILVPGCGRHEERVHSTPAVHRHTGADLRRQCEQLE